tara:strand:+ start:337 stop:1464 length:1128 start_codon:yes stop_codon:yes gene_type:complete
MRAVDFLEKLTSNEIKFFTGVPDSLLSQLSQCLEENPGYYQHYPSANEGLAVGLAAGYHLATGEMPCVYMQNSGLGNAVNPLTSLADQEVYSIPILLVIGWRGEITENGQLKDEPQHRKQGKITPDLLDILSIPYVVVGPEEDGDAIARLIAKGKAGRRPVALLVRKGAISGATPKLQENESSLTREHAIELIVEHLRRDVPIVATTGKASRELYEIRQAKKQAPGRDFLTVGSMGHASQIAAGIALVKADHPVVCIDGDGSCFMHLGGLATTAAFKNLRHIVLNNGVHDSVGGQPTCGSHLSLAGIANACGYKSVFVVSSADELPQTLGEMMKGQGSAFLEIVVQPGARPALGRPKESPVEAKKGFMEALSVMR